MEKGDTPQEPVRLLETAESAEQHRKDRGDPEPRSPQKSGLGSHIDIGGVADFGPVGTERNDQLRSADTQAVQAGSSEEQ